MEKIILWGLILILFSVAVAAGVNDPATFGNLSDDTAWIGGTQGLVNATGNITTNSWFRGMYNWVIEALSNMYLHFNGTTLGFNETHLNQTIDNRATDVNSSMKSYVDSQDIIFNDSMKSYVDDQDASIRISIKNNITADNITIIAYVNTQDGLIRQSILDNITADNQTIIAYVNTQDNLIRNSILDNITADNITIIAYVDSQDILFNNSMAEYVSQVNDTMKGYVDDTFIVIGDADKNCSVDQSCENVIYTTDKLGNSTEEIQSAMAGANTSFHNTTTGYLLVENPPVECIAGTAMTYTNMTTSICETFLRPGEADKNCSVTHSCTNILYTGDADKNCSVDQSCENVIYTTDKLGNTTDEILDAVNGSDLWLGKAAIGKTTPNFELDVRGVINTSNLTAEYVAIGLQSAVNALHVENADEQLAIFKSTDDTATIVVQDDDTATYVNAVDGLSIIGHTAGKTASNNLVIDATGDIGIAIINPLYRLHVWNDYAVTGIDNVALFDSSRHNIVAQNSNGDYDAQWEFWSDSNNKWTLFNDGGSGGNYFGILGDSYSPLAFVIAQDGNVGIGSDTSPDYVLDVQGTFHADGVASFDSAVSAPTLDTGQGANELYDMDQNVLTTSIPQFAGANLTGMLNMTSQNITSVDCIIFESGGKICSGS